MSESLISFGSVDWRLEPEIHPTHFSVDLQARLDLPITVNLGGRRIGATLYFAVEPTIDPRVRLSGASLELDIARCPWYFGFTPPPRDLPTDATPSQADEDKRREFLSEVLKAAGDELRTFLADLRALPGKIFAALRAEVPKLLDHVVGFLRHIGSAEDYIKHCLDSILHAVEHKVRRAIEWTVGLARDVAHFLLTTADQLGGLAADVCRATVESTLVLYEGVLEGSGQLAVLLQESFAMMAKDAARFSAQVRSTVSALVQETVLRTKAFAAEVEGHVAAGIAAVVKAEGFAEAKIALFMEAVAHGISDGAAKVKKAARDVADFLPRLVETATVELHKFADDPSVLYGWIGKFIRIGLKAYLEQLKLELDWIVLGAQTIGRAARALTATIQDFAQKTVDELEPYVKAVLNEWAELATAFGKASRAAFTTFLQRLAAWKRSLFHAACRVLQGAEDLLAALIGPEHLAEIKEALKFICSFLDDVAVKAGQAIDSLYQIGRALAVDLPRDLAKAGQAVQAWVGQQAESLSAALKKAFRFLVLEIGGFIQRSPVVQALIAIINGMLHLAKAVGVFIAEKGKQLGDWLRPKIKQALDQLEAMASALESFMEGTGQGSVLEARFRRLSLAQPRGSKRSKAKVKLLDGMPSDHKLPGDDVLLPALQALAGEAGLELGALELFSFNDWRFAAPHPVSGLVELPSPAPSKTRFLPIPMAPDQDMVFRVCMKPRMWVVDPRYSWGYGASNQLRLADADGDGKVEEWEVYKEAQKRREDAKDGDPFTAADMQSLLDQAKNVLHGVPYREIGAPFGLLGAYEGGSWTWFAVASIGDEDVGAQVQRDAPPDPKAPVGSLLKVGAAGTLIPSGQKVDRTGIGLFWQGKHTFGPSHYPVLYHVEKRIFWDQFASGFGNPGTSTFLVLRGGHAGNDFQLRGELYQDFTWRPIGSGMGLPIGMYAPTIRATFGLSASGGAAVAGSGGFRLGLQYASKSPIAVLLGDEVKDEPKSESVVEKVLAKLKKDFQVNDILPTLQKLLAPVLRLVMFDREYEAKLACAGAIAIGDELAIASKRDWARENDGRKRTLRFLEQADAFFVDWKHSEGVRRQEATLCSGPVPNSKQASEELLERVKALWAAGGFSEEQRKDLVEIRQLNRSFMRYAIGEPTAPDQDLERRFDEWVESTGKELRQSKFEGWTADQRQTHYLKVAGEGALALKDMLWAGDFAGAWEKMKAGIAKIDATPAEYADELCEAIIALAALVDIFYRMAVALGDVKGLKKKIGDDLKKRREESDKKAAERAKPDYKPKSTILGRLGAQAHDDKWAHEVLEDSPSWGNADTGLADGVSLTWSIDGGIGVGAGGSAAGAGLGAFALVGLSVSPPSFSLPGDLLKTLSSKLMLVRFAAKSLRAQCEIVDYAVNHSEELPKDPAGMFRQGMLWYVQVVHQVLSEVLNPGTGSVIPGAEAPDAKRGHQADPLEDWLFEFLSGSVVSVGAKVEGLAKAVGAAAAAEARVGLSGELSVTLASLLDPLIEALQRDAERDPSDTAPLKVRTIPKIMFNVTQDASAGVALGPAQLDVGLSGRSLSADLIFPDGSPWRRTVEDELAKLLGQAVKSTKNRAAAMEPHKQEGGFFHGMAALCEAIDKLLRAEIPAVQEWEKKSGKAPASALVTNPAVQHMFSAIRDPAFAQKRQQKRQRIDELTDLIGKNELHFDTYPDTPGVGVKAVSAEDASFDVSVLLPDAEVDQLSPKDKTLLARSVYRIPLSPAPAHVAQDTFRTKSKPKAKPLQGLVVGFAKKSEAEAFVGQRDAAWVDSAVASIPPWASSRAGASGTAQWYHWLNTKLFTAVEDALGNGKRIEQPKLSVDDKGVVLDFGLVERGLLDKAPFTSFGLVKESEILITEAKILEKVWEDDVVRLRAAVAASIRRKGKPEQPPAAAAAAAPAQSTPVTASETIPYSVKRAQAAVNHQLREPAGIPGWTKPLVPDGCFGPKTGGALNAWAQKLGDVPVTGDKGGALVEVGRKLAQALNEAHDKAVVSFAPPLVISEDDAPWMAIARGEMGQTEIKGAADNPRIREYHASTTLGAQADEVPWCSSFVNWTLTKAGIGGTRSAAAASWAEWGSACDARRGAIVVIYNAAAANSGLTRSGNHVGFLVEDVGWGWKLLGGNQHDMVRETCFSKKNWALKAVRWPE